MKVTLASDLNVLTKTELMARDWIAIKTSEGHKYMVITDDFGSNQCLLTEGKLVNSPSLCKGVDYIEFLDKRGDEFHVFEFRQEMFDWMESDE